MFIIDISGHPGFPREYSQRLHPTSAAERHTPFLPLLQERVSEPPQPQPQRTYCPPPRRFRCNQACHHSRQIRPSPPQGDINESPCPTMTTTLFVLQSRRRNDHSKPLSCSMLLHKSVDLYFFLQPTWMDCKVRGVFAQRRELPSVATGYLHPPSPWQAKLVAPNVRRQHRSCSLDQQLGGCITKWSDRANVVGRAGGCHRKMR